MEKIGNIVHVNLSNGRIKSTPFSHGLARQVLGGFGFNTWYLYHHLPKTADALGPENILVLSRGLLTGTAAPASSRCHISAKSPLSGLMGSANVGGHLGTKLRSLNIAALVIQGKSPEPVSLIMDKNGIFLNPAQNLWGKDTRQTSQILTHDRDPNHTDILSIGIAGENKVPFACIMNGEDHAAGRTGMGAVMGSKYLKAILVEGITCREKSTDEIKAMVKAYVKKITTAGQLFKDFSSTGSAGHVKWLNDSGQLGTRNYRAGSIEGVENIDGKNLLGYVKKKTSCHRCPVRCKANIKIKSGRHKGFAGGRPEYETVINMGALCGLNDPDELLYLSNLANILGLDTISTGSVLAFAMDLFDRGIITTKDTGGLAVTWGNAHAMETLMNQMAQRQGIGKILSMGVKAAAIAIGKGAEKFAFHSKNVEIYGADPRGTQAIALSYAVSLRGGDFTSVYPVPAYRYSPEQAQKEFGTPAAVDPLAVAGKAALVRRCLFTSAVVDSLGLCKVPFLSIVADFTLENESQLVRGLMGLDMTADQLTVVGERLINMEKIFNLTHGATTTEDNLPALFQNEGLPNGPMKGITVTGLTDMVQEFYQAMGWDKEGVPTPTTLARLELKRHKA